LPPCYRRFAGRRRKRFFGTLEFIRFQQVLINMAKVGVPESVR
jgi:hypothetical protein